MIYFHYGSVIPYSYKLNVKVDTAERITSINFVFSYVLLIILFLIKLLLKPSNFSLTMYLSLLYQRKCFTYIIMLDCSHYEWGCYHIELYFVCLLHIMFKYMYVCLYLLKTKYKNLAIIYSFYPRSVTHYVHIIYLQYEFCDKMGLRVFRILQSLRYSFCKRIRTDQGRIY